MGIYVTRKCPRCGATLELMERDYVSIGPPYFICGGCKATLKVDHINEWDLMSTSSKAYQFIALFKTAIVFSVAAPAVLLFYGLFRDVEFSEPTLLYSWLGLFVILFGIGFFSLYLEIKQSKKRMNDLQHINRLIKLGINIPDHLK